MATQSDTFGDSTRHLWPLNYTLLSTQLDTFDDSITHFWRLIKTLWASQNPFKIEWFRTLLATHLDTFGESKSIRKSSGVSPLLFSKLLHRDYRIYRLYCTLPVKTLLLLLLLLLLASIELIFIGFCRGRPGEADSGLGLCLSVKALSNDWFRTAAPWVPQRPSRGPSSSSTLLLSEGSSKGYASFVHKPERLNFEIGLHSL